MFRISKPGTSTSSKTSSSTKQQQQSEQKPEKNAVLLEYKQFVESLQKAGPSASLLDNSMTQSGKQFVHIFANFDQPQFQKIISFSIMWLEKEVSVK